MKADEGLHWVPGVGQHMLVTGQARRDRTVALTYTMPGRSTGIRVVQSTTSSWWVLYDGDGVDQIPDAGPFRSAEDAKAYAEATYRLERGMS